MFVKTYARARDTLMFLNDFSVVKEPATFLQVHVTFLVMQK